MRYSIQPHYMWQYNVRIAPVTGGQEKMASDYPDRERVWR